MGAIDPMGILKALNWVDILVLALAVRIIYASAQTGFVIEFFKLLAAFAALFVSFHYYSGFAHIVQKTGVVFPGIGAAAFIVLWLLVLLICKFIRDGFVMLFTVQAVTSIDKWGAMLISVGRVVITTSMVMFFFLVTNQGYLERMTKASFSGKYLLTVSPKVYSASCDRFITPLFTAEKKNPAVAQVLGNGVKK
jgi:uncharacterized membrane protein required for colicin V production